MEAISTLGRSFLPPKVVNVDSPLLLGASLGLASLLLFKLTASRQSRANLTVHNSLAKLPPGAIKSLVDDIYPEDYYPNGNYVALPMGRVRYWLMGPEDGDKVVLIHGLSIPSFIFKGLAPVLASHGFRVLLYDLYGRGYSDAPQTSYTASLYTTQLALLMQHIGWQKAYIVGLSMGGGIAAAFAADFPWLVNGKIVFMASVGLLKLSDLPWNFTIGASALLRPLLTSSFLRAYQRTKIDTRDLSWAEDEAAQAVLLQQLQSSTLPGYVNAVLDSLAIGPVLGQEANFKALGKKGAETKVLVIWGTEDAVVPIKCGFQIKELIPHAEMVTVEGAGHELGVTHPQQVSRILLKFLETTTS